ncbi:DNA recombination protein RmuC [Corynebacteriaceae bacterium 6-324]
MSYALPITLLIVGLLLGLLIGAALGWFAHSSRYPSLSSASGAGAKPLEQSPQADSAELSLAVNKSVNQTVAQTMMPLEKAMDRLGSQLQELEADRATAFAQLSSQVHSMSRTSTRLSDRTDQLVTALRSPNVRGRWGEIQLERVVELGGMVKHVDFESQVTAYLGNKAVRPDLVVNLSADRHIVVDAKVPFSAYLDALETSDPEEHAAYLRRHAHMVRTHVQQLSHKDYIEAFSPTPEFVVLFTPADPFLDAALGVDPELLEFAFERNVVIATPTTLFALLRTVALGWRHEDISDKAREVQRLGSELYSRLNTVGDHYNRVGRSLEKAVEAFNSTLSSMDSRVMVTARRLSEMDIPTRTDKRPTTLSPATASPAKAAPSVDVSAEDSDEESATRESSRDEEPRDLFGNYSSGS